MVDKLRLLQQWYVSKVRGGTGKELMARRFTSKVMFQ